MEETKTKEIWDFFTKYIAPQLKNATDCFVPDESKPILRRNFNIGNDEEIYWMRDTSFWNDKDKGTVLTDKGIHNNYDSRKYFWDWGGINKVWKYNDRLYFDYRGSECYLDRYELYKGSELSIVLDCDIFKKIAQKLQVDNSTFVESDGKIIFEYPLQLFVLIFNAIAQNTKSSEEYWKELYDAEKYQEAYEYAQKMKKDRKYGSDANKWAVDSAFALKNYEQVIEEMDNLELSDWSDSTQIDILEKKYLSNLHLGNLDDARNDCLTIVQTAPEEWSNTKRTAKETFKNIEKQLKEDFLGYQYNKRKVLMPVKKYTKLDQQLVHVIEMENLPDNITFPMGHPIANQLYIGHPLLSYKYIPFENYQLELIEDKVREFCTIVQALGATEISIECLNSNAKDDSTKGSVDANTNVSVKVKEVNTSYTENYSRRLIEELNHSIQLHQTFNPTNVPFLPDNLVWYKNEPSWQRLYNQRMTGSLLSHEERIETRKSQVIESSEMEKIKGEVKGLATSIGGTWNESEESKYQMQENAVLAIKVQFAPMNQLTGDGKQVAKVLPASNLSSAEQEYLDEAKACLADGEIGDSERRILNKVRVKLGISEERATELEASLQQPKLTEEEKEYLEAYKDAMEDGIITDKERRLLDKMMQINDISEERAKEIEAMY